MDKTPSKKFRNLFLVFVIAILVLSYLYYFNLDYGTIESVYAHATGDLITFNLESGIYSNSIEIILSKDKELPSSAEIYYTLSGDDPTMEKGTLYTSPIFLSMQESFAVYPLKVVVYYKNEYSDIFENDYILCNDKSNEYNVYIVSLTCDSENLYDYNTGILVPGRIHDEYLAESDENDYIWQGNYSERGEEWIKPGHVVIIDGNGKLIIDQGIGLGISGGTSSSHPVKSFKMYADLQYDKTLDNFQICLENNTNGYLNYSWVNKYKSIRLRSGSHDREDGNIRSAIVSRLAQNSNFNGITSTNRGILFLNGTFYSILDIQQNYSDSYLANRFGLDQSELIEKSKSVDPQIYYELGISDFFQTDLNNPTKREHIENFIDMDDYLLYYTLQILCNNTDWPNNNYEVWHYNGNFNINNIYSDGRYRFLIYDTDLIYNTNSRYIFFEGSNGDTFIHLMEGLVRAENSEFQNIMSSIYYRDKFITLLCDLENTSFSVPQVISLINEEDERIDRIRKDFISNAYSKEARKDVKQIRDAARKRPTEIETLLERYFNLKEKYKFYLETSDGVLVSWNNMNIYENDIYTCDYYKNVSNIITADPYPGYEFKYWEVNGEKVYDTSIEISDELAKDDLLYIKAIASPINEPSLIINEISSQGYSDWISIYNAGISTVWLADYYISDNEENPTKYRLPEVKLQPGDELIIYGSKNYDAVGDYICNFSLSSGETLTLYDGEKLMDSIVIPRMSDIETYKRFDNSNKWLFYKAE